MTLDDKSVQEFKDIFEQEYGRKLTMQEASDAAHNLVGFFDLLQTMERKERYRKERLKEYPKGYHLTDGIYSCCICEVQVSGEGSWYDKNGIKCLLCQRAVEKRIVPAQACSDSESWYSLYDLMHWYGIHTATARKFVREGKLKARIVPRNDGKPYFYVFMIKDNPSLKNPKPHTELVATDNGTYTSINPKKLELNLQCAKEITQKVIIP
jgi:alpha-amylase/alpha-mannosidase (GH57 family)